MQIIAALYIDNIETRPVPGGATHLDLLGVQFSGAAPQEPPFQWTPHLCVIVHCPADAEGFSALEVTFHLDGKEVARNMQPLQIEPGKFGRQLVRPEIDINSLGTVEAHVRIGEGPATVVPYTFLAPVTT